MKGQTGANPQVFKKVEKYLLYNKIGEGQFGQVYKSINSDTGEEVAIKIVSSKVLQKNAKLNNFVENEVKILTQINNPYVVKLYDVLRTSNNLYFVYEYCEGGTLEQLIKDKGRLSEASSQQLIKEILSGFVSLFHINILHRDIKPGNIFFRKGKIKIGDFGFCKQLDNREELAQTQLGSPLYMAPEVLFGNSYDLKADIWSIGVIYYELLYGVCPFETNNIVNLISKINQGLVNFPHHVQVCEDTVKLIQSMLVKDPSHRIDWQTLFDHMNVGQPNQDIHIDTDTNTNTNRDKDTNTNRDRDRDRARNVRISVWDSSPEECLDLFFVFQPLQLEIGELVQFQQFVYQQRAKLYLLLDTMKAVLVIAEVSMTYKVELMKLIKVYQSVLGLLSVLDSPLIQSLNLSVYLIEQIKNDPKTNGYFQAIGQENALANSMAVQFLNTQKTQHSTLQYDYFDYPMFQQLTLAYTQSVINEQNNNQHKLAIAHSMLDILLINIVFESFYDKSLDFEYQKYFTDIKKFSNTQLLKIIAHKQKYILQNN